MLLDPQQQTYAVDDQEAAVDGEQPPSQPQQQEQPADQTYHSAEEQQQQQQQQLLLTPPKETLARLKQRRLRLRHSTQLTPIERQQHQQQQEQAADEQETHQLNQVASAPTLHNRSPLKLRRPKPVPPAAPSGVPFRRTRFRGGRESLASVQVKSPAAYHNEATEVTAQDGTESPTKEAGVALPPLKVPPLAAAEGRASKVLPSRSPVSFRHERPFIHARTHPSVLTTARALFSHACPT